MPKDKSSLLENILNAMQHLLQTLIQLHFLVAGLVGHYLNLLLFFIQIFNGLGFLFQLLFGLLGLLAFCSILI